MKPSENLFELIKCLSPDEIKFIHSSSQFHIKGKENKYAFLFNEIEKKEVYNESELIKKMKYTDELNRFAFLKNYLYNFVLSSLEEKNNLCRKRIRSKITQSEILLHKGLLDIAEDVLQEAEEESRKTQLFDLWLRCLQVKLLLAKKANKPGNEIILQIKRILNAKRSFLHYKRLFVNVRLKHHQSTFIRDIENKKEFKEVHEEELLESDPAYNFHHKVFFYFSKGIVYYAKKDYQKSLIITNELIKMWEKFPWMIEVNFLAYFNTYYNKALSESITRNYALAIQTIKALYDKINAFNKQTPYEYYMLYNLWIKTYNMCGYYDEALNIINDFKSSRDLLRNVNMSPYSHQLYHFFSANVYFGVGDFRSANRHINEIINNSIEYNNDITCIAQLMSLVIHYEMGNSDLLAYRIKSVYRFLNKRDCLELTISHVLDFLRRSARNKNNNKTEKESFIELKKQIEEDLKIDPIQKDVIEYFDILSWLNSRIEEKPFMEIAKAKCGYALG